MSRSESFSKTQLSLLETLSDGMRHQRSELVEELPGESIDERRKYRALSWQLCKMRKVLRMLGQEIICELYGRKIYYRHVRYLTGTDPVPLEVRLSDSSVHNTEC